MGIKVKAVFIGKIEQVVHAHLKAHGIVFLKVLIQSLLGFLWLFELFALHLDAGALGKFLENMSGQGAIGDYRRMVYLQQGNIAEQQAAANAKDHGLAHPKPVVLHQV